MYSLETPYPLLLNADVGEGFSYDESIINIVDIANIACGAHAGDRNTISVTLDIVQRYGKYAFAHVGYDDRKNFGRKSLRLNKQQLSDCVHRQLDLLLAVASQQKVSIYGVKPHGALYHDASANRELGEQLVEVCLSYSSAFCKEQLIMIAQSHSDFLNTNQNRGVCTIAEAFVDRRYSSDRQLLSRSMPDATITDAQQASAQAYSLSYQGSVLSIDNTTVNIVADTLCLHGDSDAALAIAQAVATRLLADRESNK